MNQRAVLLACSVFLWIEALSQATVDVTFRYTPPSVQSGVWIAGEFNGWRNDVTSMTNVGNNTYSATVTLLVGGFPGGTVPGAYQYKFYYSGVQDWPNDPLNPRFNATDHNNSILYVKNPTIYQFIPNERTGLVRTANPVISAFLFPQNGTILDTATISLKVDTLAVVNVGKSYDPSTKQFSYKLPFGLDNGSHNIALSAGSNSDSVTIVVQAGAVQITNIGGFVTLNSVRTLYGSLDDARIQAVKIVHNNVDTLSVTASAGKFTHIVNLVEGLNTFRAVVIDSAGTPQISSPVSYIYKVTHVPHGEISYVDVGSSIIISGSRSTDPDSGQTASLQYSWSADSTNPALLSTLVGANTRDVVTPKPTKPGDYIVRLIVSDFNGNKDTARSLFTIARDGKFEGTLATVPQWVKQGRIYSIFFKGMTQEGTINAALPYLSYIKDMGFSILWILPVMQVYGQMDNFSGIGYNIKNFNQIDPAYGTNDDFGNFVRQAHKLGLKVILDVTPNHTSFDHPFVLHARQFRENSPYWDFYLHTGAPYPDNGLGVSLTNDGFQFFGGFSSQLLNYNWADIDARSYMIDVYKWWIMQFDIDGYRFDVYWGPHNRANNLKGGESEMGIPVREALKRIKPDIYLLGETSGTGGGTESNYADRGGGVDGAYDWSLYGAVSGLYPNGFQNFVSGVYNNGFFPGPNSSYLRFLENQDEERIVYRYGSYLGTKPPGAVIFTSPGMPMLWQGQEYGIGLLVPQGQDRRRAVVNWNFLGKEFLQSHYQRLAQARAQIPAFSTQQMRVLSASHKVVAFVRPFPNEDGIVAVNFNDFSDTVSLQIANSYFGVALENRSYKLSDVYNDTISTVMIANGELSLHLSLPAYGSAVFVLSDSARRLVLPSVTSGIIDGNRQEQPHSFQLLHNYPNPFNPTTTIAYDLPESGRMSLRIYDVLGQEVAILVDSYKNAGRHWATWSGISSHGITAASGVYFARLQMGSRIDVKKLLLLR